MRAGINFIYNQEFGKWLQVYCTKNNLLLAPIDRSKEPDRRKQREGDSMVWKVREAIHSAGGNVPDIAYENRKRTCFSDDWKICSGCGDTCYQTG